MSKVLFTGWDAYTRKALWAPAGVAAAPMLLLAIHFAPNLSWFGAVVPVVISLGVAAALVEWVRPRGRRTERRLVAKWDGLPTTRALRQSGGDSPGLRNTRRRQVEAVSGHVLPTEAEELADPVGSGELYRSAVFAAIAHVRADGVDATRLDAENASYGFRRNARSLKWVALVVLMAAAGANIWLALTMDSLLIGAAVMVLDLLLAWFWSFGVTDNWVKEQADTYSDRFFVTLDATAMRASRL